MAIDYLEGFNKKEKSSWKSFYEEFYVAICSYVDKIVKEEADAEDITQETFINLWNSSRQFGSMQELTWYLYKAAYTNAIYFLRTKNLHRDLLAKYEVEEVEIPDDHFSVMIQEELTRQLHFYIKELPPEAQKILQLSLNGCSGKEIAEKLGITIHTVKLQKNRSFKYLRKKLQRPTYLLLLCAIPLQE